MSLSEQIEALASEVEARLEALKEAALAEIREAKKQASTDAARYEEVTGELEGVEARLMMLRAEKEDLPIEHSRAVLTDDVEEELRIKERYSTIREEIEELEDRRTALSGELSRLLPHSTGHELDVAIRRWGQATLVASEARTDLEALRDRIVKALDETVQPVAEEHNGLRGRVESWSNERRWANSPVGRGAWIG